MFKENERLASCHQTFRFVCLLLVFLSFAANSTAQSVEPLNIAVVESPAGTQGSGSESEVFKEELVAIFEGRYKVDFKVYRLDNPVNIASLQTTLNEIYAQPEHDLVVVLDLPANQLGGLLPSYPKPTFLPLVISAQAQGFPLSDRSSGTDNLSYLTREFDFLQELQSFQSVAIFDRAAFIVDPVVRQSLDNKLIDQAIRDAETLGLTLTFIELDGSSAELLDKLPEDIDTAIIGAFPSVSEEAINELILDLNQRGLFTFSVVGESFVERGVLAGNQPKTNEQQLARLNALNVRDVLLGKPASELEVFYEAPSRLILNMETSRQIRYSPTFDVLSDAKLLNEDYAQEGPLFSLQSVALIAIENNLILASEALETEQAVEDVRISLGDLLPTVSSSLSYTDRKRTASTDAGTLAEDSTDAAIQLSQPLFVEETWANYSIQKLNLLAQQEALRETSLDIVQSAVTTYLNVLLAESSFEQERFNLEITRQNLDLAQSRVDAGSTDASDLFRWQSEIALAKQALLDARSSLTQSRQSLNQLLNRPVDAPFRTTKESLENPSLLISDGAIRDLIVNRYALNSMIDFFAELARSNSPELRQLDAEIKAAERQLKSLRRDFYVPDLSLTAEATYNLDENRAPGGIPAEDNDWFVGVELSFPVFEGGSRLAENRQARLIIRQLETLRNEQKTVIELNVRNEAESANASYASIELAQDALEASENNFDLVTNSYEQGTVGITTVLDARDALISARENNANAVYAFLVDLMNLQRAVGAFDFFLTEDELEEIGSEIRRRAAP